jgi:hypothetical protein
MYCTAYTMVLFRKSLANADTIKLQTYQFCFFVTFFFPLLQRKQSGPVVFLV